MAQKAKRHDLCAVGNGLAWRDVMPFRLYNQSLNTCLRNMIRYDRMRLVKTNFTLKETTLDDFSLLLFIAITGKYALVAFTCCVFLS